MPGVGVAVIPHDLARGDDPLERPWPEIHPFTQDEEARACAMVGEDAEYLLGPRWVRAVIERQGDLPDFVGASDMVMKPMCGVHR